MPEAVGLDPLAVEPDRPRIAAREDGVGLDCVRAARALERDPCRIRAEADHLHVSAGARREPLRPDVQRLEEVRLPGTVRPVQQDDTRHELELERRVRAEVAERDLADDQPARRMGMIRYQKLSSGAAMRPGRRRLISLSWTVSAATASSPSRRKSGLNPISSSSPA